MPLMTDNRTKALVIIFVAVVLAFFVVRPILFTPSTSASSPDLTSLTRTPVAIYATTPTSAPAATAMPTPTATPTPEPNRYIWIPWRSQFDGTTYASANCGPAALSMAMSYYGEWWSTDGVRKSTIDRSGVWGYDEGTDWPSLQYAAEKRDFTVVGLYDDEGNYRQWTIDDLLQETEQQHPVMLLVRQRMMPGHEGSSYAGDHYIVVLGEMADGRIVYHDSAFTNEADGSYRIVGRETLLEAWGNTSVGQHYSAMALVWDHESRKWDQPSSE